MLNRGSVLAFGDFRVCAQLGRYRSAAHAAGMRRSVDGGSGVPHEWHTCIGILCLYSSVDTCQPCNTHRIPDENRRSRHGRVGSVASCVGSRECGSPFAIGDPWGGLGFDGTWRVVAGCVALRVAANTHSEAGGVTALLERLFPLHFQVMFAMLARFKIGKEDGITDA